MQSVAAPTVRTGQSSTLQAVLAIAAGVLILWGAGFAHSSALHNATHDTRHAFGLPCH